MTYTVQAGDTLWAIARKYNCSITEIVAANSDRIKNPNGFTPAGSLRFPKAERLSQAALPMLSCLRIRKAGYTSSDRATPSGQSPESVAAL